MRLLSRIGGRLVRCCVFVVYDDDVLKGSMGGLFGFFVDVNRKDYRAWYGLGQAYELLNMHQYSLYYYQRATALR